MQATQKQPRALGSEVWDRLWEYEPSATQDEQLIDREERQPRWKIILERLEDRFGSLDGLKTVELGSGRGDLSLLLARRGAKVSLFDASTKVLELAKKRFATHGLPVQCIQGDLLGHVAGCRATYDVSISSGVIEHFRGHERTRAVQAHFNVLRTGGMTVISVPNAWCLPYRMWKCYLEIRRWWPYGLELPYSKSELVSRIRGVGFARNEALCLGFWRSVSAHWGRSLLHQDVDWSDRTSYLDGTMGLMLLLFGWKGSTAPYKKLGSQSA